MAGLTELATLRSCQASRRTRHPKLRLPIRAPIVDSRQGTFSQASDRDRVSCPVEQSRGVAIEWKWLVDRRRLCP